MHVQNSLNLLFESISNDTIDPCTISDTSSTAIIKYHCSTNDRQGKELQMDKK